MDRSCDRHPLGEAVSAAVEAGVDWVQLRDRELEGAAWLTWARELCDAARGARVLVNRRVDVALAIQADGVHLGFDAMSPSDAKHLLPDGAWVGVSAHSPAEVFAAAEAGASYAHLAPIWLPLSKPASRPALGIQALREASAARLTLLAQGGITKQRCAEVLAAGADGVAVTGAILMADDPGVAARALREALDSP